MLKKKKNRKANNFINEDRSKIAYLIASNFVSLSQSGEVLTIHQSIDINLKERVKKASRETATRCLQESYLCFMVFVSLKLSESTNYYICVDCGSDESKRDRMAIKFGGLHPQKGKWSFCVALEEMNEGHSGINQAQCIVQKLDLIQNMQRKLGVKKNLLVSIQFDCL